MSYIALSDIQGKIPASFLLQALDDDGDGVMDAHVQVIADACAAVDAVLGLRFSVPFTAPLPPIVGEAAKVFACEMCYQRRGVGADTNPWTTQANTLRSTLEKIASGKLPLAPTIQRQQPSGTLISEPSRTHDNGGRRMA